MTDEMKDGLRTQEINGTISLTYASGDNSTFNTASRKGLEAALDITSDSGFIGGANVNLNWGKTDTTTKLDCAPVSDGTTNFGVGGYLGYSVNKNVGVFAGAKYEGATHSQKSYLDPARNGDFEVNKIINEETKSHNSFNTSCTETAFVGLKLATNDKKVIGDVYASSVWAQGDGNNYGYDKYDIKLGTKIKTDVYKGVTVGAYAEKSLLQNYKMNYGVSLGYTF